MTDKKGEVKWLRQPKIEDWQAYQKAVGPKYSQVSESIRRVAPGSLTCSMFCGGKNCKYDNPAKFKKEDMVIQGLYSSWVTEDILATSRPSSYAVKEYCVIEQFQEAEIKAIINLQHPGEHASCGFGLEPSGFSYNPQEFMDGGVFYYNYGWNDYGVRSLHSILDIVKVMDFALSEGKVAVHCHAGLGRTGVVIACCLIYRNRLEADEAIHLVRKGRPKAIQTRGQIACVKDFFKYLKPMWIVFSLSQDDANSKSFTLNEYLQKQKNLLHGEEERKLRYVPKIIFVLCQRILRLANIAFDLTNVVFLARKGFKSSHIYNTNVDTSSASTNESLSSVTDNDIRHGVDSELDFVSSKDTLNALLPSDAQSSVFNRNRSISLCQGVEDVGLSKDMMLKCRSDMDLSGMSVQNKIISPYDSDTVALSGSTDLEPQDRPEESLAKFTSGNNDDRDIQHHPDFDMRQATNGLLDSDSSIKFPGQRGGTLEPLPSRVKDGKRRKSKGKGKKKNVVHIDANLPEDHHLENDQIIMNNNIDDVALSDSKGDDDYPEVTNSNSIEEICKCLSSRSADSKVLIKVDRYKRKLNSTDSTWTQLENEDDIRVVSSLLWAWLEHLKEPVLTEPQTKILSDNLKDSRHGLKLLDRNSRKTFECLLVTISKLKCTSDELTTKLCRRLAVALTKDRTLPSKVRTSSFENQLESETDNTEGQPSHTGNGMACLEFIKEWISMASSPDEK